MGQLTTGPIFSMNYGKLLAYTVITLSFMSGLGYLYGKNYRMAIYWIAAAILNLAVTI